MGAGSPHQSEEPQELLVVSSVPGSRERSVAGGRQGVGETCAQ